MNAPIIDPLQGDFPEVIDECLEHGIMKCIAFNRRGTLLAAGCSDGSCIVWDFMTRGIAKELRDKDCVAAITSVCWSKSGHHILVSASDNSLILWNVAKGKKVFQTTLQQTPLHARLHPGGGGSSPPSLCLVSPFSSAPLILDFHTKTITSLPVSLSDSGAELAMSSYNNFLDGSPHYTPTAACFNKYGDLVYLGNSIGDILIIDHKNNKVCGIVPISGGSVIKNIVFSRNGQYLLTNSSDRTIRMYENLLPLKAPLKSLEVNETHDYVSEIEKLKAVGLRCLSLFREFQDSITKVHWKAPCVSGDSEWVVGGSAGKGEHKIYIWDRAGHLVKILEGPKEALVDLAWHPVRPIVVSVSLTGLVYIWAKDYTENWSAFAPDFRELEENEEYVEQEDEFDLMADTEKVNESGLHEDDEVDITTVEKDSCFSDSDISQDELYFLPSDPCPDVLGSPLSEGTGVNSLVMNHNSSQSEAVENSGAEDTAGTRLKRKRKPSKKLLELQAFEITQNTKASDCSYMEIVPSLDGGESRTGLEKVNPPIQKKLRSDVWNHFKKVTKPNGEIIAVCNYCSLNLSGGCGTSHLRSHYKRKHGEHTSMAGYEEVDPPTKGKSQPLVWIYFKKFKKPNKEIVVVCNICSANLVAGHGQCRRMRSHLKRKHAILIAPTDSSSRMESVSIAGSGESMTGLEIVVYPTEGKSDDSIIRLEKVKLPTQGRSDDSLTRLEKVKPLTQLRSDDSMTGLEIVKPPTQGRSDESLMGLEKLKPPTKERLRSVVWNYFKKVKKPNNKVIAVCNFCSRSFVAGEAGTTHLRNHLTRKHAKQVELPVSSRK